MAQLDHPDMLKVILNRSGAFLIISILLLFLLAACGGEVHWTNGTPPAPSVPPAIPKIIEEKFLYQKATGTQVVAFVFAPRQFLIWQIKQKVAATISEFVNPFFTLSDSASDFQFIIQREVYPPQKNLYSPAQLTGNRAQWPANSLQFFTSTLTQLQDFIGASESSIDCPFDSLSDLVQSISTGTTSNSGPVWTHLIYFRDKDYSPVTQTEKSYLETSMAKFKKNLAAEPLSPFRSRVTLVSYLSSGATRPYREVSRQLQGYLGPFNHLLVELDPIVLATAPNLYPQLQPVMNQLAQSAVQFSSKMILRRSPKRETLEIRAGNTLIPRQDTDFDDETNELTLPGAGKYGLQPGDEIRISYEEKTR